jgi:uncharacterized membrane protein YoaK (UPF0700 family)
VGNGHDRYVTSPPRIRRLLPVALGHVAGYVDGCTFVALFGLFVAQVTGSFVAVGDVFAAGRNSALLTLLAIPAFILGAAVASALSTILRHRGRHASSIILLGLESVLLAAMLATALFAGEMRNPDQPAALIVGLFGLSAMGVQNAFVRLHLKGAPSTNVMTTNTGNLAIDAAHVLAVAWLARSPSATSAPADAEEARSRLAKTAPIVLAFLVGTVCGTLACRAWGFACLALPLALLSILTSLAALRQFDDE